MFRRGAVEVRKDSWFEFSVMPDAEKEAIARSLLAEFGARNVIPSGDGELVHSCILPFGLHKGGDRNPSASLNYRKLTYICHAGCGSGGLLWLIATCRGSSTDEARRWLSQETGIGGVQNLNSLIDYLDSVFHRDAQRSVPLPSLDPRVLEPWQVIHPYLTEVRGIPEENIVKFRLGYGQFDVKGRNSHRIVIPHFWEGQLVGWQSRRMTDDGTPKYLNTPDFPKDRTLFGVMPEGDTIVVVESPMSVISKHHVVPNMVATFGATITESQKALISRYENVILWFDNDQAGYSATHRVAEYASRYSKVGVVSTDIEGDPADEDDEGAADLIKEFVVPYAVWSPPTSLAKRLPKQTIYDYDGV